MHDYDKYLLLPEYSEVASRERISLVSQLFPDYSLPTPFVSAPMSTVTERKLADELGTWGGFGVLHRYMPIEELTSQLFYTRSPVGVAVSPSMSDKDIEQIIEQEPTALVLDVAHGDSEKCYQLVEQLRQITSKQYIVSANIITEEAAGRYASAGVDALRIGMGVGSACITRKTAGVGRNQIDAVSGIYSHLQRLSITNASLPLIADGGIRQSGDVIKALAAGASTVMIGGLFAACEESPAAKTGDSVVHAGMGSREAHHHRFERMGDYSYTHIASPEGTTVNIERQGTVCDCMEMLFHGVRQGLSYLGVRRVKDIHTHLTRFLRQDE